MSDFTNVPTPKGFGQRLIAGLLAIMFGFPAGGASYGVLIFKPKNHWEQIFQVVVEHVAITTFLICIAVLIWALFAPRWMERLMVKVQKKIIPTLALVILGGGALVAAFFFLG